jgi:hypothetical protein
MSTSKGSVQKSSNDETYRLNTYLLLADNIGNLEDVKHLVEAARVLLEAWEGSVPNKHTELCEECPGLSDVATSWKLLVQATKDIDFTITTLKDGVGRR